MDTVVETVAKTVDTVDTAIFVNKKSFLISLFRKSHGIHGIHSFSYGFHNGIHTVSTVSTYVCAVASYPSKTLRISMSLGRRSGNAVARDVGYETLILQPRKLQWWTVMERMLHAYRFLQ